MEAHEVKGVNSRLDPIQAAVLRVKLRHLDNWNQRRQAVAALYLASLRPNQRLTLPHVPVWAQSSWHLFVVQSPERDALQSQLEAAGIHTLIHYPAPPHRQQAYASPGQASDDPFPIATKMGQRVLSLPIGPHLSIEWAREIVDTVNRLTST